LGQYLRGYDYYFAQLGRTGPRYQRCSSKEEVVELGGPEKSNNLYPGKTMKVNSG